MATEFEGPASNIVEEIQEEMLEELASKKHKFVIQKSRGGIPKIKTSDNRIIIYGVDEHEKKIFIKFPFPAKPDVNKRQAERVYTLANKIPPNPHLPRILGTKPLSLAGIQGVVSEEGLFSLKDYLEDPRISRKEKITAAQKAVSHGAIAMEILHHNGILVCDYKDSNTVLYEDNQWGIVDPESFKPIGKHLLDEETVRKLYKSSGAHTESFLDWLVKLDDVQLTTESDRYALGCVLFKAYFDNTPQTAYKQQGNERIVTPEFIKEIIKKIPDEVDRYVLQRTLGELLPEGPLPTGKRYTDFRFSDISEVREVLETRKIIYFEKDLEQPEYQAYLIAAKQLKATIASVDKKRGGLENTLSVKAADELRIAYTKYVQAYENQTITTLPQRENVHDNITQIVQPFFKEEYQKLKKIIDEHLPNLKESKLRSELWDVYAKSEILGYNAREEFVPLENIVRLTNDNILRMKTRIDNIK